MDVRNCPESEALEDILVIILCGTKVPLLVVIGCTTVHITGTRAALGRAQAPPLCV